MAYQLIDDLLDYVGNKTIMGKNTGDDLSEGKLTLPIILALAKTTGREKNSLLHALKQKSSANLEEIVDIIPKAGQSKIPAKQHSMRLNRHESICHIFLKTSIDRHLKA